MLTPVEELLIAASSDPAKRSEFYKMLLSSNLFVLGTADGAKLVPRMLQVDGGPVLPMFTSPDRILDGAPAGTPYVGLNAKALLESIEPGTRAVLNPFSKFGKELTPEEIAWLRAGAPAGIQETVIPAGVTVFMGQPAKRPEALLGALRSLFQLRPAVVEAYLAQVHTPGKDPGPHCVIGVRADGAGFRALLEDMAAVARGMLSSQEFVDFVEVRLGGSGQLERYMLQNPTSFYRRTGDDSGRGAQGIAGRVRRFFGK
jgi:hypothetical protein